MLYSSYSSIIGGSISISPASFDNSTKFRILSKLLISVFLLYPNVSKAPARIRDVITSNNIKVVFVWDEFSDFFRLNKNSLGDFQKVVSLCQELPFYFIVVKIFWILFN